MDCHECGCEASYLHDTEDAKGNVFEVYVCDACRQRFYAVVEVYGDNGEEIEE